MNAATERVYVINPHEKAYSPHSKYFVGRDTTGGQVIIFADSPKMHAYFFSLAGEFLKQESRETNSWGDARDYEVRIKVVFESVMSWIKELDLSEGTIRVKKFESGYQRPTLRLIDYPEYFDDGCLGDDEEMIRARWASRQAFVLVWNGFDYWIDGEGNYFQ